MNQPLHQGSDPCSSPRRSEGRHRIVGCEGDCINQGFDHEKLSLKSTGTSCYESSEMFSEMGETGKEEL